MTLKSQIYMFKKYSIMEILSIVVNIMIRKIKLHKLYNLVLSNNIAGNIIDETCMEDYNAILIAQPDLPFTEHIKLVKEKEYFSKEVSIIIDEADYFLKNTFKVFGSDWIRWDENNEMAWHRDFLSNYCWDKTSYYIFKG